MTRQSLFTLLKYHKVLAVLMIVLLVSAISFYSLPEIGYHQDLPLRMYANLDLLDEADWIVVNGGAEFNLTGTTLTIENRATYGSVFITSFGAQEGKVIITEYTAEFLQPRITSPLRVTYAEDSLKIAEGSYTKAFRIHYFISDLPVFQFTPPTRRRTLGYSFLIDERVLYIQVPENIEVIRAESGKHISFTSSYSKQQRAKNDD